MGVPQGSKLGASLFSSYISHPTSDVVIRMYADDTVIYTHEREAEKVSTTDEC